MAAQGLGTNSWLCSNCKDPQCQQPNHYYRKEPKVVNESYIPCAFCAGRSCETCNAFHQNSAFNVTYVSSSGTNQTYVTATGYPRCYCSDVDTTKLVHKNCERVGRCDKCRYDLIVKHGILMPPKTHTWQLCLTCQTVGYHKPTCTQVVKCAVRNDHDCSAMIAAKATEEYKSMLEEHKTTVAAQLQADREAIANKKMTASAIITRKCVITLKVSEATEEIKDLLAKLKQVQDSVKTLTDEYDNLLLRTPVEQTSA